MGFFEDIGAFIGEAKDIVSQVGSAGDAIKTSAAESITEISDTLTTAATEITETVEQTGSTLKETVDISDGRKS